MPCKHKMFLKHHNVLGTLFNVQAENFIVVLKILTHLEFDPCNMFQKSQNRSNKRFEKLRNTQTFVWNIPEVNRLI